MAQIKIAADIFGVVMELLTLWYCCRLLGSPKLKPWPMLAVYGLLGVALLGISIFAPSSIWRLGGYCLALLLLMGFYQGKLLVKLLVIVLLIAVLLCSEATIEYFLAAEAEKVVLHQEFEQDNYLVGIILSKALSFITIRMVAAICHTKQFWLSAKYLLMLLGVPMISILIIIQQTEIVYHINEQDAYWRMGLIVMLLLGLNLLVFYLFERLSVMQTLQEQVAFFREKDRLVSQYQASVIEKTRETNHLAHDMNNTLTIVSAYIQNGKPQQALAYLEQLKGKVNDSRCQLTGFEGIDAILVDKQRLAEEQNSKITVESLALAPLKADELDIARLLGAALDNALEAAVLAGGGEITVRVYLDQYHLELTITNPIQDLPQIDDNHIATGKADKAHHGFGLQTIRQTVETYNGVLRLRAADGRFILDAKMENV